jgi:hypothetical protein
MPMTCSNLPELSDIQLLIYLDGEADQDEVKQITEHLAGCKHCSARKEQLRLREARLTAAFYRSACPSPMELGEYRLGALGRRRAQAITRHVTECPHCARELAQLQSFLADLAPAPVQGPLAQASDRIRVLVARLAGGARDALAAPLPPLAPAYAGVRGEVAGPAIYEAEDAQVLLDAQPSGAAAGRFELLGLLTGVDPARFTVNLWRDGALTATLPVDEGGNFIFSDLVPGAYELVVRGPDREIYIEELKI